MKKSGDGWNLAPFGQPSPSLDLRRQDRVHSSATGDALSRISRYALLRRQSCTGSKVEGEGGGSGLAVKEGRFMVALGTVRCSK